MSLLWLHNGRDDVSNHQTHDCLHNRLFRRRSKKTSKLRVTGLCAGNSPGTGEFPTQMDSNAENVSIWWRHHGVKQTGYSPGRTIQFAHQAILEKAGSIYSGYMLSLVHRILGPNEMFLYGDIPEMVVTSVRSLFQWSMVIYLLHRHYSNQAIKTGRSVWPIVIPKIHKRNNTLKSCRPFDVISINWRCPWQIMHKKSDY